MRFTELFMEIKATYPERSRRFHVLATRYYIGVDNLHQIKKLLTEQEVRVIINNR